MGTLSSERAEGAVMLFWCLLLGVTVAAVQGEEASGGGGFVPPTVQPWGVNPFNLGGFGPGSTGSFDGAEGGDFGGGLGGPFFGPSTMPGFSPGYGMRPYDISNNILYHEMTMGMGLNPFSSNSVLGNEDEVESSNEDLEVGGYGGYGGIGRDWGYGGTGYFGGYGGFGKGYGGFGKGYGGFGMGYGGYGKG